MKKLFHAVSLVLSVALFGAAGTASAQQYPSKPIRLIILFPPAGATDVLGRALGQKLIPESSTPEQLSTLVKDDLARWAKVARQAGVRLD
jgi:tripartite-type tricarboxylate transporter receptor subunit TctC